MKNQIKNNVELFAAITICLLLLSRIALANPFPVNPQVQIDLKVVNKENKGQLVVNYLLGNATVELVEKGKGTIQFFTTDDEGRVSLLINANSAYELVITKDGFKTRRINLTVADISGTVTYSELVELKKSDALPVFSKR